MKKMILTFLAVLILSVGAAAAAPQYHTVARGETLFGLAQRYGVTVAEFLEFNPGLIPENLQVGRRLLIPVEPLWSYHVVPWPPSTRCRKSCCLQPTALRRKS